MAESVDRVFVHALNTVKKIPKTGAQRPPPADRMRLYGLYKQAMEGDVDGVMDRPTGLLSGASAISTEELQREQDKWDAWHSQRGLSRTEAKRRYIEALIDTIHRYATTPTALELVSELEFVWNQIKDSSAGGSASGSPSSLGLGGVADISGSGRNFQRPLSGTEGPMKVLSPMSEEDEAERQSALRQGLAEEEKAEDDYDGDDGAYLKRGDKWSRKMERAIFRLSAEVAALREQITSGREWRARRERSVGAWLVWGFWVVTRHVAIDFIILGLLLLWMRRRGDRRLEDHIRGVLGIMRDYLRKILPSR
ncbi:hypothetical protein VTK73DRAFT_55 [Phialemonium thermophilum]|uniref:ACB domain-containing protein n=1 Tax=Phialemonium thermophilum TaxID=223376 RepID=A0ABR3Y7S7_9PEZI